MARLAVRPQGRQASGRGVPPRPPVRLECKTSCQRPRTSSRPYRAASGGGRAAPAGGPTPSATIPEPSSSTASATPITSRSSIRLGSSRRDTSRWASSSGAPARPGRSKMARSPISLPTAPAAGGLTRPHAQLAEVTDRRRGPLPRPGALVVIITPARKEVRLRLPEVLFIPRQGEPIRLSPSRRGSGRGWIPQAEAVEYTPLYPPFVRGESNPARPSPRGMRASGPAQRDLLPRRGNRHSRHGGDVDPARREGRDFGG
ncbi:hypothetical protein OJF2_43450 [Aquisphaera giovannonii]|uniref:Uncharacterized protein n=1 Tax=Aquisphaera giovannonii TaxID=406548 RepID=A0A5B9W5C8_9BACT|nr:hypothetical protein OJF2_43450 [Aquisphaera giovannonii]